jgi:capsular polysaccharide biosynthesis protein
MEDLTVTQQIDLFRRAELVISPHGAALANILFCPAATAVLELSPDCEYRPFFNQMAAKLGLSHAVLPCPTDTGGFNGRLDVDSKRLQRLLNLLQARQAR